MTTNYTDELSNLRKAFTNSPSFSNHNNLFNFVRDHSANLSLMNGRIAVLSNFTFDTVLPLIYGEMAYYGYLPTPYVADFDSIPDNILNPHSKFYEYEFDFIILSHWLETLSTILTSKFLSTSEKDIEGELERLEKYFNTLITEIRKKSTGTVFINNFPLPEYTTLGIFDSRSNVSHVNTIIKLNQIISQIARSHTGVYIVDYFSIFARFGYQNCVDEKFWQMTRAPIGRKALLPIAEEYGKFFRALSGKSKKCIILDCDNTLWGGIIGEDGLSGIKLGNTHPGQSFVDFQQEIVNLYHRGVIVALCSKNNEADVLDVLHNHQDMVLKKEHVTTYQINWDDKVTNIKKIASALNIGLDSLVFIDDNPFECNLIKEQLPEVTVIELQKSAPLMKKQLQELALFDSLTFSSEDKNRNQMYASDQNRKKILSESSSLEDYLKSLGLVVTIAPVGEPEISRVAQLTQKTNQFNLTTKRYTEADISNFVSNKNFDVIYLRVADKVSDLGIVGLAIIEYTNHIANIDTLLMSCRALGRGAETALLSKIVHLAQTRHSSKIIGQYISTPKNSQVADLYLKNNFLLMNKEADSKFTYEFDIEKNNILNPEWITILDN
jgi:FkbH-like protein